MMNCPSIFTIVFKSQISEETIDNLIVYVNIIAKKKNDYTIGPLKTNSTGNVTVTKKDIEQEIAVSFKDYPMDYASRLEDCVEEIEIKVYKADELKKRVSILSKHFPKNAKILEGFLLNSKNDSVLTCVRREKIAPYIEVFVPRSA